MDVKQIVRGFLNENFYVESDALSDETSFLKLGVVDSTGILEIIAFLEDRFAISVGDEDLLPENLDSLRGIEAFVARKSSQEQAAIAN